MERRLAALAAFALYFAAAHAGWAATFTVDSLADEIVADGRCTLREAVVAHNAVAGANDCGAFDPAADDIEIVATGTIWLDPTLGELELYAPAVTLSGPGADLLTIDGRDAMSVLVLAPKEPPSALTVRRLTIAHGFSRYPSFNPGGGAIRGTLGTVPSQADIAVEDAALVENRADNASSFWTRGAAITSWGSLVLRRTLIARNEADQSAVIHSGNAVIEDCEFRDNAGQSFGAAISSFPHSGAKWQVRRSLFRDNVLQSNGGVAIDFQSPAGTLEVENSTFAGNAGASGSAIWVGQAGIKAKVRNSTFADTVATAGFPAGIVHLQGGSTSSVASLTLVSCLFARNDRPDALDGGFPGTGVIFTSFNLFDTTAANLPPGTVCASSTTGAANLCGVATPGLDPLASNGGPTQTTALQPASPARDAGHNPSGLTTDQRGAGYPRTAGAGTDIGAFESSGKSALSGWPQLLPKGTSFALLGTYLGGAETAPSPCKERVDELVVAGGEVYVLGSTACAGIPGTAGGAFPNRFGRNDVFLARLTPDLSTVLQATYFGGGGDEYPTDMVVTGDAVYAVGVTTSMQLPGTFGAAQTHNQSPGDFDGFVVRFDRALTHLVRTTFLGGSGADETSGLAIAGGEVFVAGSTDSSDFPGTASGAQPTFDGLADGFVARLPLSLQGPIHSTYLGAGDWDFTTDLAIGGDAVFVAGYTASKAFPGTAGGAQSALAQGDDAFVARLSLDLAQVTGGSYLGGAGADYAFAIATSDDGTVYVGGRTASPDLPFTSGGVQPMSDTPPDGFVARFDPTLAGGVEATYLGAKATDSVNALWAGNGRVWAVGTHGASGFLGTSGAGGNDAFLAVLDERLETVTDVATYGGSADETGRALALDFDAEGEVVGALIGGSTLSKNLPLVTPPAQAYRNGSIDGWVARLAGVP